jgi:hypothetical protein
MQEQNIAKQACLDRHTNNCRNRDSMRYVGWDAYNGGTNGLEREALFSDAVVNQISQSITKHLGRDLANGRPIVVPNHRIISVIDSLANNWREETGDIYGRYNVPNNNQDFTQKMILQTITLIVDYVRNSLEMENINGKLSIWNTVLGEFNEKGLRSHAPLTANIDNNRRLFQFNMNY